MGLTIGNSLRRVVLSSIEGVALTSLNIEGVKHEFDSIEGVQEDVLDIIFNLKSVVFGLYEGETVRNDLHLDVQGENEVKASDLQIPVDVKVINLDQHICSITDKKSKVKIHLQLKKILDTELLKTNRVQILKSLEFL